MDYIESYSAKRPFFILPMFITHLDLPPSAMVLYARLYTRCMMSKDKGIIDAERRAYCYYSVENMAKDMKCSRRTIQTILRELEKYDLIYRDRKGPFNNRIYVKQTFLPYYERVNEEQMRSLMDETINREAERAEAKARWEAEHGPFPFPDM